MHFVSLIQFELCYRILKQIKSVVFTFHMFNLQPSWNVHIYGGGNVDFRLDFNL